MAVYVVSDVQYFKGWPACDGCGNKVAVRRGVLALDTDRSLAQVRALRIREVLRPRGPVPMADLQRQPAGEPWRIGHDTCVPGDYAIEFVEIDDSMKALQWSLHLADKSWFDAWQWSEAVGRLFLIHGNTDTRRPAPQQQSYSAVGLRFRVFQRDGFTCQYCGARPPDARLEADHRIPRSMGGPTTIENLITACWECNHGKGARYANVGG